MAEVGKSCELYGWEGMVSYLGEGRQFGWEDVRGTSSEGSCQVGGNHSMVLGGLLAT